MSQRSTEERLLAIEAELDRLRTMEIPLYSGVTPYTPTYDGAVSGTTTYSTQVGFYVRIENIVIAWGTVVWTAATGTGNAQVSLPFTASSTANSNFAGALRTQNVTFANGSIQVQITAGATFFLMHSPATNAAGTNVAVEAAGTIIFTVVYAVD